MLTSEIENLLTYSSSNGREGSILKSDAPKEMPLGNDIITNSNFRSLARDEITDPLIISFAGSEKKRRKSFRKFDRKIAKGKGAYAIVEEFEIIESTKYQMGVIDLSDRLIDDPYKTIGKMLKGNKIEYLQAEQIFELV